MSTVEPSSPLASLPDTKSRTDRSPDPAERGIDGRDVAAPLRGGLDGGSQRRLIPVGHACIDRAGASPHGVAEQPDEGGVGAQDGTGAVERRDGHRGGVEEAGEPHLGGAQVLRRLLARRAADHQRPRRTRHPVLREGDAVQQPHRQALAAAALEIDVELLGLHLARRARHGRQHGGAIPGQDVAELQPAGPDLGQIVVQPFGQRGVEIGQATVGLGREEACGRVVEEVDRVLEFLEHVLVPLALARHIGDAPQDGALAADPVERADFDPVPADRRDPVEGRRQADLLRGPAVIARRLGKTIDGLRNLGRPGEQPLHGAELAHVRRARHGEVGLVGVEEARITFRDQKPLAAGIGDQLGQIVAGRLPGELQHADGVEEQRAQPDDGEDRQQPERETTCLLLRQNRIRGGGCHEQHRDGQDQQRTAGSLRAINRRQRSLRHVEPRPTALQRSELTPQHDDGPRPAPV